MQKTSSSKQSGFAHVELAIIIVTIALIVGVGYWVVQKRHQTTAKTSQTTSETATAAASAAQKAAASEASTGSSSISSDVNQTQGEAKTTSQIGDNSDATNL